jgi:hypothetical protein
VTQDPREIREALVLLGRLVTRVRRVLPVATAARGQLDLLAVRAKLARRAIRERQDPEAIREELVRVVSLAPRDPQVRKVLRDPMGKLGRLVLQATLDQLAQRVRE